MYKVTHTRNAAEKECLTKKNSRRITEHTHFPRYNSDLKLTSPTERTEVNCDKHLISIIRKRAPTVPVNQTKFNWMLV